MRQLLGVLFALAVGATTASSDTFPSRTVTMVVPFAAGGPSDVLARLLAESLSRSLHRPVVVENVTGAAGSIAVGRVARATGDGYTLLLGHWSTNVINGAIQALPYDLVNDFTPIALLPSNPMFIISRRDLPAQDLGELVAWLKSQPAPPSAGTAGVGSASHMGGVYFQRLIGRDVQFVQYRGTAPALNDLIGGQIDFMVDQTSNSIQHVKSETVRAYAVTAERRLAAAPEVPTVDEAGAPGLHVSVWYGLWAPAGIREDVVDQLTQAAAEAMADPEVGRRLSELGLELPPQDRRSGRALAEHQKAEIAKWWPIVRAAHLDASPARSAVAQ